MEGETGKFAPLALEPMETPPVGTVYQLIVLPAEVALRLVEVPQVIGLGLAVTGLGAEGGVHCENADEPAMKIRNKNESSHF